nr:hypothetical protein Q903MT_gene3675 [Picea sitchensis]
MYTSESPLHPFRFACARTIHSSTRFLYLSLVPITTDRKRCQFARKPPSSYWNLLGLTRSDLSRFLLHGGYSAVRN